MSLPPLDLPQSVLDIVDFTPVESIALAVLRRGLPDVPSFSLVPKDTPTFFVLVRRSPGLGSWRGDERVLDEGGVIVHVYAEDPDGDEKGSVISEAVRKVFQRAFLEHWKFEGLGSINVLRMTSEPTRVTDWITSVGPVQFADLPMGDWRYETRYAIRINPPR